MYIYIITPCALDDATYVLRSTFDPLGKHGYICFLLA